MRLIFTLLTLILSWSGCFSQVCINEILSLNSSGIRDVDQDFSDWIEIYNPGENAVDIIGYGLSDDRSMPMKWQFPSRIIQPKEFLLVYANGKDYELYTNFKIDADSEKIYLSDPSGVLIDSAGGVQMTRDISLGRRHDGSSVWCFQGFPTPGESNSIYAAGYSFAPGVTIDPPGGKFDTPLTIILSSLYPGDSIYYTTDGSVPGPGSLLYTEPFEINSNTVIRARILKYNMLPGQVATATYVTGRDHDIPIVCLSTDRANLWDDEYGIYTFGLQPMGEYPYYEANYWKDWERPVHFELYDEQGIRQVNQEVGLKIYGAWSRAYDQKSFALYAKKSYGKNSMEYQFFNDKPITTFKSVILRNSGDDNNRLQFQDCFITNLTREMDLDRQAYQPAAVYINGEYWGLLNLREKISEDYIAENYDIDADSVNLLEGPGDIVSGSNTDYLALTDYLNTHTTLEDDQDFEYVRNKINTDNFLRYEITEIYVNNRDWPCNNIKFWKTSAPESRWRWILYDTDAGYGIWNPEDYMYNMLDFALETDGPEFPNPPWSTLLLRRILTHPDSRNSFVIQFCDRLNLDFHPDRVNADLDYFEELYDHEMAYHFDRWWGDFDEWHTHISDHRTFGENRPEYCREFLAERFNLGPEMTITLDVSDSEQGSVKLNTIYPKTFPFSGIYFKDLPVQMTAMPKPGFKFVRWEGTINSDKPVLTYDMSESGEFTAVFSEVSQEDISVIINEINYTSSASHDTKDWVELYNNGSGSVDLGGWTLLDSGIDSGFVFNAGTILAPGGYLVVCRNLADFRKFNPEVTGSVGDMAFKLSGEGEVVRLFDNNHQLVDMVNYGIASPWPVDASGTGKTIELKDPLLDNSQGFNWQAITMGGTPGERNAVFTVPTNNTHKISDFGLDCFPSPFRDQTTISISVDQPGHYRLSVIDMQGRMIKVLADKKLAAGSYWIDWTAEGAQPGIYTIQLSGNNNVQTKKIVKIQ